MNIDRELIGNIILAIIVLNHIIGLIILVYYEIKYRDQSLEYRLQRILLIPILAAIVPAIVVLAEISARRRSKRRAGK